MAFDNVTFFELHLDDARFGGERAESADEFEPEPESEASERRSGRRVLSLAFLVLLGVGASVAARRMRRDAVPEADLEDAEAITVE